MDTHGPRLNAVIFQVITSDASLKAALVGGAIQGPEWAFNLATWGTITPAWCGISPNTPTGDHWCVQTPGWSGYANEPTTGPDTGIGLYYTLLNVHPTSNPDGGTFKLALHNIADQSGLNPLYYTSNVWQTDIWNEIYDSPLAVRPTEVTTPYSFFDYMTTGYSVAYLSSYTTGTGTGWFSMQGPPHGPQSIPSGEVITLNFRQNITWTDNLPLTAYDYNFSLYAWDISLPPSLPDVVTPLSGVMTGPTGLLATYINPSNPYQIRLYIGSTFVTNLGNIIVPVLSQRIFRFFNTDLLSGASGALDTTQPLNSTAVQGCGCFLTGINMPSWLRHLPNLEVGTGPFYLSVYNGITAAGQLLKNLNYQRAPWKVIAALPANNHLTGNFIYSFAATQWTYNPSTYTSSYVPITNFVLTSNVAQLAACKNLQLKVTGTANALVNSQPYSCALVYKTNGQGTITGGVPLAFPLTLTGGGVYHAHIMVTTPGYYEIVIVAHYTYLGLARTWYQATGFKK